MKMFSENQEPDTKSCLASESPHAGGGSSWDRRVFQSKETACASLEVKWGIQLVEHSGWVISSYFMNKDVVLK